MLRKLFRSSASMTPSFPANGPSAYQPIVLKGHTSFVYSIAYSPSGQLLASGSYDKTIRLWDGKTGADITALEGLSSAIYAVVFSPDSTMLASGSGDTTVKLWSVDSWKEIAILEGHSGKVRSLAYSPNGVHLASGSADKTIRLWSTESRTSISTLNGHSNWVNSVAFSPDSTIIASGSTDSYIRLWNVQSGTCIATLNGHSQDVMSVQFSPNGENLASGSADNTIQLWNPATGTKISTFRGHLGTVKSVAFSPDGKQIASGSRDKTIQLWDVASKSLISKMDGHRDDVISIAISPDGTRLASASEDKTVRIWNLSSQEPSVLQAAEVASDTTELAQNAVNTQNIATTSASTLAPPNNYTIGTSATTSSQQDTTTSLSTPVPLNNDITGLVSLEDNTPIGYGGFGDLFMGIHIDHGRVALKKPRRLLSEALIRRFLREVNLWCSVSHPHVLPCLGMCKIGVDVYVVSPFIENGDLLSCMGRGQILNRSKLLFEVAEALTHLHHKGIVHGDVKAQNILLSDDGSALLCDFGLAKAFDTMATSTEAKGAGSVRWMAPELFLDESRSMASDVYSLGITIAEVLSGHAPYPNISESFAVMLHVAYHDGRPAKEPLSSPEGKSYGTLWKTAEKCWVKDPKARPHMAEVLGMLFPLTREKN